MKIGEITVGSRLRADVFSISSQGEDKYAALVKSTNRSQFITHTGESIYILKAQAPEQIYTEVVDLLNCFDVFSSVDLETDLKPIKSGDSFFSETLNILVSIESAVVNEKHCFLVSREDDHRKYVIESSIPEAGFMPSDLEKLL